MNVWALLHCHWRIQDLWIFKTVLAFYLTAEVHFTHYYIQMNLQYFANVLFLQKLTQNFNKMYPQNTAWYLDNYAECYTFIAEFLDMLYNKSLDTYMCGTSEALNYNCDSRWRSLHTEARLHTSLCTSHDRSQAPRESVRNPLQGHSCDRNSSKTDDLQYVNALMACRGETRLYEQAHCYVWGPMRPMPLDGHWVSRLFKEMLIKSSSLLPAMKQSQQAIRPL